MITQKFSKRDPKNFTKCDPQKCRNEILLGLKGLDVLWVSRSFKSFGFSRFLCPLCHLILWSSGYFVSLRSFGFFWLIFQTICFFFNDLIIAMQIFCVSKSSFQIFVRLLYVHIFHVLKNAYFLFFFIVTFNY